MSEQSESPKVNTNTAVRSAGIPNPITELITSFRELKDAPRGFWYTNYTWCAKACRKNRTDKRTGSENHEYT